jgi:hypothetical protein
MALEQPLAVVLLFELKKREPQLFDGGKVADPEQLLLQRPTEALGDAVALRLST